MRRLYAGLRRWLHIAVFGWSDQCMHRGCPNPGEWAHPDGGPQGICRDHVEAV